MKILKLIHPTLGVCSQKLITRQFGEDMIKRMWLNKYGEIINSCTYEIYEHNAKSEEIINLRTGDVYKNKYEAKEITGLTINYINKILGKRSERNTDYFLVWNKNKAI